MISRIAQGIVVSAMFASVACVPPAAQSHGSSYGSAWGSAPAPATNVPGRYATTAYGQAYEVTLHADGTASFAGQPGHWQAHQGGIVLSDGQQWLPATVDGDWLRVQTAQGPVVFQRIGAGGDTAVAVAASSPAGAPATSTVDTRLVGCWEDFAGSTGGAGNGSVQRTLQLAASGSYAARSFVSISAGELSSVSDEREDGAWSADAGAISLTPHGRAAYQVRYELRGGLLFVNGNKYIPCT